MVSLTEIQELIFRTVDALSSGSIGDKARPARPKDWRHCARLSGDYLASHTVFCAKSSTEGSWEQFERDLAAVKQGRNAAPPKPSPVPTENETVYRAPENMRGLTLHTVGGMLPVPDHGIVHVAARPNGHDDKCDCAKCSMHRDLKGRGFREQHARKSSSEAALEEIRDIHRAGHARQIAVGIIGKQRGTDAGDDVGKWFHDRGSQSGVLSEVRVCQSRWAATGIDRIAPARRGISAKDIMEIH